MMGRCRTGNAAVVLLSGGLDSLVAANLAAREHHLRLAITCDYGQRAATAELAAAARQAARLNIPHRQINLRWLGQLASSALTNPHIPLPAPKPDTLDDTDQAADTARQVWVPNRNAVLLMVAAAYAETLSCDVVVAGFNREEAVTFSDNSPEFVAAVNRLLQHSTQARPTVVCPTLHMTKTEMVQAARQSGIPLDCIHSCYEAGPRHCWQCESCLRLRRALTEADCWQSLQHRL